MAADQPDVALLRAVLLENCESDDAARLHLLQAAALGVDPLDYCAHRFGLGHPTVWRRAAAWGGFSYRATLPVIPNGQLWLKHLDELSTARSALVTFPGREIVFGAPRFAEVLELVASPNHRDLAEHLCFVSPDAVTSSLAAYGSDRLLDNAWQQITQVWPHASASQQLTISARVGFAIVLLSVTVLAALGVYLKPWLVPLLFVLLMLPGLVRLRASLFKPDAAGTMVPSIQDAELPVYTVLVPLRDEANMVPQLLRALSAIDYPPEKLDICFVVEETSVETVRAVEEILGDPRFRLIAVPDAGPRTKPKALNFALPTARGELIVVYDAEDVPEPSQLRLAASHFAAQRGLACLQAELVPENYDESPLTALFAGEYAGLFGKLLPLLARWKVPLPLGGTSNHFRTVALRKLGGWDAFNVTEDADLGVRLARRQLRTATFRSRTYEEAPVSLKSWMAQRTRWMKGWMSTYIVHTRHPGALLADLGWRSFLAFQVLMFSMILAAALHSAFLVIFGAKLLGFGGLAPVDLWDWVNLAIEIVGYGGAIAVVVSGLVYLGRWQLLVLQAMLPLYWILHSVAAARALLELIRRPFRWAKTTHGLTRRERARPEVLMSMEEIAPVQAE